jgi:hypothetical protein
MESTRPNELTKENHMAWIIGGGAVALYFVGCLVAVVRTKGAVTVSWPLHINRIIDGE